MKPSSTEPTLDTPLPPRTRLGWGLMAVGAVLVLWAVIGLAGSGYGTKPIRSFAQRRSYDMVKVDVHRAFPRAMMRATAGLALLALGARRRRRD